MVTKKEVLSALKKCKDPEIGLSVVDLGFIYDVKIKGKKVKVKMTLTTPACPLHSSITMDAKEIVESMKGVDEAEVELVWDPPWTPDKMSDSAKKKLGMK